MTICRRLSELERKPPVTCLLLGLNIAAYVLPEAFLPWGIDLTEVTGVCLQPARIVKLMLPSFSAIGCVREGKPTVTPACA